MMNKKTILTIALALVAAVSAFAADTYESGKLFYANDAVDNSSEYIATVRTAEVEYLDGSGNVIDSDIASAYYTVKADGASAERAIAGDSGAFEVLDSFYDGYVMTPFNDNVIGYDKDQLANETVNGAECLVYEFEVGLDLSELNGTAFAGKTVGWDFDEDDTNGDLVMTVYIDASTGLIVKQDAVYEISGGTTIRQSAWFASAEADGDTLNVPVAVVTEGRIVKSNGTLVTDTIRYVATETFASYEKLEDWHN